MHPISSNAANNNQSEPIRKTKPSHSVDGKTSEISKKTIKAHEAKNINLKKFQESPDEPDFTIEQIDVLSRALDKFVRPVNKDSPFYGTDLVIIDESFNGVLPLNGIKQSELVQIEKLYQSICDGKEKFQIVTKDTNDPFKADVENMIKKLLTRKIGRKLIQTVIKNNFLKKIEIIPGDKTTFSHTPKKNVCKITLGGKSRRKLVLHPTGELKTQSTPLFIGFAHELIHASHIPYTLGAYDPTFSHHYDDLSEQKTITGLIQDFPLNIDQTDSEFKKDLRKIYNELNEWNITAAFTDSKNVYYPRFGHRAIDLNPFRLSKTDENALKSNGQYEDMLVKRQRHVIQELVEYGLLYDLRKMKNVNLHKIFENAPTPAIFLAAKSGNIDMVRFLMDKGFDLYTTIEKVNALTFIFHNIPSKNLLEYYNIIEFLLEKNIDVLPAIKYLISATDLQLLNSKSFRPLMELLFMHLSRSYKLSSFFLSSITKPNVDKGLLGTLVSNCAAANLKKFITSHDLLNEVISEHEYYSQLADTLYKEGIHTKKLDDILYTVDKLIKNELNHIEEK